MIQRILGAYALLIAVAVGVNFIATPLYDDGSTGFPVWSVLNWFMAAGVLVALISSVFPKPGGGCEAKILLGGSLLLCCVTNPELLAAENRSANRGFFAGTLAVRDFRIAALRAAP